MTRGIFGALSSQRHSSTMHHVSYTVRRVCGLGHVHMPDRSHYLMLIHRHSSMQDHLSHVFHLTLPMCRDPAWEIPSRSERTAVGILSLTTERFSTQNKVTLVFRQGERDGFHSLTLAAVCVTKYPGLLQYQLKCANANISTQTLTSHRVPPSLLI